MSKAPITCESVNVNLVIRKNKPISLDLIKQYCETYCVKYAFIEHKGDISVDTGLVEGVHYHLVLKYRDARVAFSTRLNQICEFFHFDNTFGLEIDKIISLTKCIQYLIHKNNKEKTPHNVDEIIHNYDLNEFSIIMEATEDNCVTYELLFKGCMECNFKFELVKFFSPSVYRSWRSVILDMWEEIHTQQYVTERGRILNEESKKLCKA